MARDLLLWARNLLGQVWWGTGETMGSCVPYLDLPRATGKPIPVHFFAMWTNGSVEMYFQHLKSKPGFESDAAREDLRRRLNEISGLNLPPDSIARRPWFPMIQLSDPEAKRVFKDAVEWALGEVKRAG